MISTGSRRRSVRSLCFPDWISKMINRAAIILKYNEPFVPWMNEADPYVDDPGTTIENANEDRNVYLISDREGEGRHKGQVFIIDR